MSGRPSIAKSLTRIVPLGIITGAALELFMIKVRVGEETFYDTAKRLEAIRRIEEAEQKRELERRVLERTQG